MSANHILRAIPPSELEHLSPHLTKTELKQHDVLFLPDAPIDHVDFIESGFISLLVMSREGTAIEVGVVGSEGTIGGAVAAGTHRALSQTVVQIGGRSHRISTKHFLDAYQVCPTLRALVQKHHQFLYLQAQQNVSCHALHTLEGRLCRWLLTAQDVLMRPIFELTQEFLSHMLGVQRSTVSVAAHHLQAAGLIRYRRGKVEITDRTGLEESACECYGVLKKHRDALTIV